MTKMEGLDLNENPEIPDLSSVRDFFQNRKQIEVANFIGTITINSKQQLTKSDFSKMFREELESIRRDTQI